MGRRQRAQGIRRARRPRDAAPDLSRGAWPARTQRADDRNGNQSARPYADALGDRGSEEKSYSENSQVRGSLAPVILGAGFGLSPRVGAAARERRRRRLRRQRPESLDLDGA